MQTIAQDNPFTGTNTINHAGSVRAQWTGKVVANSRASTGSQSQNAPGRRARVVHRGHLNYNRGPLDLEAGEPSAQFCAMTFRSE
jgi:hypothetical protein